jgi:hypothetical protein
MLTAMASDDSNLDRAGMSRARALLAPPRRRQRIWPVLAAAALLAVVSIGFAVAMVLAPPVTKEHVAAPRAPDR